MTRYVAFLRGINSGKGHTVKMVALRKVFENLGFADVKTILASGNVLFESDVTDEKVVERTIESALPQTIGFPSDTTVRTVQDIQCLVESDPFGRTTVTSDTKLYVTFLKKNPATELEFPIEGPGYMILGVLNEIVYSIVDLSRAKTPDLMQALDSRFGKGVTTRNWNTIERILKAH